MDAATITTTPRRSTRPTTRRARPATRLVYVRRRIAAVLLGLALVLVLAQAGAALGGSALAAPERRPAEPAHTVVVAGDSFWSVAARLAPDDDPRPVVDALVDARDGAPLEVGERVEWSG
jgi:hypothetical protein